MTEKKVSDFLARPYVLAALKDYLESCEAARDRLEEGEGRDAALAMEDAEKELCGDLYCAYKRWAKDS